MDDGFTVYMLLCCLAGAVGRSLFESLALWVLISLLFIGGGWL